MCIRDRAKTRQDRVRNEMIKQSFCSKASIGFAEVEAVGFARRADEVQTIKPEGQSPTGSPRMTYQSYSE